MKSTKLQPLRYFEKISQKTTRHLHYEYLGHFQNFPTESIDLEKGIVVVLSELLPLDPIPENITTVITFRTHFVAELNREFGVSTNFIDQFVSENLNNYKNYIDIQRNKLHYIAKNSNKLIQEYPIFLETLRKLDDYIVVKYLPDNTDKTELPIASYNEEDIIKYNEYQEYNTDYEIIESVLEYLKGFNDRRQKIMSDEDYIKMVSNVQYYVDNKALPNDIEKIIEINISQNLLRFTFWVLHKKLYTTASIQDQFVELLKLMFSKFDNTELNVLKIKFGNKEKVTVRGKKFIPEVIKNELK